VTRRTLLGRGLAGTGLALLLHGGYYAVQWYREDRIIDGRMLTQVTSVPPEQRLEHSLRVAFNIPPHKSPAPAPDYRLANPLLKVLGPPASRIYESGGHCGRRARLLIVLLGKQGIPARKIHLVNQNYARFGHASEYVHAVVEAKVQDRWIVLDPLYNIIYRRRDGSYATLEEIRADSQVFQRGLASADTTFSPYYPTLYTFGDYRKFLWSSIPGGRSVYDLVAGAIGPDRAREIPTPLMLETPYPTLVLISLSGALVALAGWVFLVVGPIRRRAPAPLPFPARTS